MKLRIVFIFIILFLLTTAAQSFAADICACVHTKSKLIRIVEDASGCGRGETLKCWNQEGVPGPQGEVGPEGPKGSVGDVGPEGPGPDGEQGAVGQQGVPGEKGAIGDPGLQGAIGPIGDKGPDGDIGPTGDCNCPITLTDIDMINTRIEALENAPAFTCDGTLSSGGRWCTPDPEDGTVKDMTTGLVWLKDASWGGLKEWANSTTWDDAHTRAGILSAGTAGANLSDGSVEGDWRLPTKKELYGLANGDEAVRSGSMQAFTGVQSSYYWSSTSYASLTLYAWGVYMYNGYAYDYDKDDGYYVWPVRSDN